MTEQDLFSNLYSSVLYFEQVQGWLGLSLTKRKTQTISLVNPRSSFAESYRTIQTHIEFSMLTKHVRSILITSSRPQEGKTSTAANLGVVLAQSGKHVLLMDADLRSSQLHHRFQVPGEIGLSQVLSQEDALNGSILHTDVEGLDLMPGGQSPSDTVKLLSGLTFASVLGKLKNRYDLVIVDSPPVLDVSDALVLVPNIDGVVFVVDAKTTNRITAQRAIHAIRQLNGNILGGVINRTPRNEQKNQYIYGSVYNIDNPVQQ